MTDKELLQQALDALEFHTMEAERWGSTAKVLHALRERLAREEPQMASLDPDIAKILHDNLDKLYIEDEPARQEQEPIGWLDGTDKLAEFMHKDLKTEHDKLGSATPKAFQIPVYTAPQREWVGLTEEDFSAINQSCLTKLQAAASAESILKEKNT